MIIDNTYFKNEIYIPNAKPAVTGALKGVALEVAFIIEEYSRDCLIKCLGYSLFLELESKLDITKPNGLIDGVDEKWNELLNGVTYVNTLGKTVKWRGIRFATINSAEPVIDTSFLAYYVYYFYERNAYITKANSGNEIAEAKNAVSVKPTLKVTDAWRKFIKLVQGEKPLATVIQNNYGYGLDWYVGGSEISLYEFINDSNKIVEGTYADFQPYNWGTINQFGI